MPTQVNPTRVEPVRNIVLHEQAGEYSGFPSIARCQDGSFVAVFRSAVDRTEVVARHWNLK